MICLDDPTYKQDFNDTVLYMHYRKADLSQYPNIKYLVCPCTGVDHIDFDYCAKNGIEVIYLDDKEWLYENVWATAEHTLYLMLRALKHNRTREEGYNHELRGKRVGIIGCGRIGKQVRQILNAFGCITTVIDKDYNLFDYDLREVFKLCDIITIHVPLTDETRGMIKEYVYLVFIERGGLLINVSRSEILENNCLHSPTESAEMGDFVYATKHMGGYTEESRKKTDEYVFKKLKERLCEQN